MSLDKQPHYSSQAIGKSNLASTSNHTNCARRTCRLVQYSLNCLRCVLKKGGKWYIIVKLVGKSGGKWGKQYECSTFRQMLTAASANRVFRRVRTQPGR